MDLDSAGEIEAHAVFRGRVQGVGFRATVRHYASGLGLKGSVRNLQDGSVELYAQGTREQLDQLLRELKGNPGLGEVDAVAADFYLPRKDLSGFRIIF